jgi:hypothetical protein
VSGIRGCGRIVVLVVRSCSMDHPSAPSVTAVGMPKPGSVREQKSNTKAEHPDRITLSVAAYVLPPWAHLSADAPFS